MRIRIEQMYNRIHRQDIIVILCRFRRQLQLPTLQNLLIHQKTKTTHSHTQKIMPNRDSFREQEQSVEAHHPTDQYKDSDLQIDFDRLDTLLVFLSRVVGHLSIYS